MATPKIVLFYAFAALPDPHAVRLWQRDLCASLDLRGRIIVAPHGINATVGGDVVALKRYVRITREHPALGDLDVKWSDGTATTDGTNVDFPRLSVRVRDELVTFGRPDAVRLDEDGVVDGGRRLTPEQLHRLTEERDDVVLLDGRNRIESAVGHFREAVLPQVDTTRELADLVDSGALDHLKDRPVVTYCTGGIRCEILTPLLRRRGFADVYQLDGGIARYGEQYRDAGLWQGSLYVFDSRVTTAFSDDVAVVGRCDTCRAPTSLVRDCADVDCVRQMVRCDACHAADAACAVSPTRERSTSTST